MSSSSSDKPRDEKSHKLAAVSEQLLIVAEEFERLETLVFPLQEALLLTSPVKKVELFILKIPALFKLEMQKEI